MKSVERSHPTVSLVTAHGRQVLDGGADDRLVDLLDRHSIPWSAVAVYIVSKTSGEPALRQCLDSRLDALDDVSEVLLYFNRNINPFIFSLSQFKTIDSEHGREGTEYFYQQFDNERGRTDTFLKKLSPEECLSIIADRVTDVVKSTVPPNSTLVVGVSGGGDSNALLYGLTQVRDHGLTIEPMIIKGIPDWDAGVPRAYELCKQYGLELTVVEEADVKALLNIDPQSEALIERFEREFKGDDFEFLGTLLIRLALFKRAREVGTTFVCTGLNLEDILCESLFRTASGMKPAPFPARGIGEMTLVLPLWLCPKRIIDGCFPKFSRQNYDARYPCFSLGRNLYYSVVYAMQSQFPGFVEKLAHGWSALSQDDPVAYTLDPQLGFHVERFVPFPLRQKFHRMLGKPHDMPLVDATATPHESSTATL